MKSIFARTGLGVGSSSTLADSKGEALLRRNPPSVPELTRCTESADERTAGILNQPGAWKVFLSHHQKYGGDQAQNLHNSFKQAGITAWYDKYMDDKSEEAMEEGVKNSEFFVLLLTGVPERMCDAWLFFFVVLLSLSCNCSVCSRTQNCVFNLACSLAFVGLLYPCCRRCLPCSLEQRRRLNV